MANDPRLKIKVQLRCGDEFAIGPGKAALLEAIAAHGSISAAGRALGMSYRRTWLLADSLNRTWRERLIDTAHGGARGGGARLTELGASVLSNYRAVEAAIEAAAYPRARACSPISSTPRASRKIAGKATQSLVPPRTIVYQRIHRLAGGRQRCTFFD